MDIRIARAVRLIEREMSDPVNFDAVASAVGLSAPRFHHLFRDTVGQPPGAYLRRIRLDAAALRLQWTAEPVGHIAFCLGYQSQASFTQAFQRRFEMAPTLYRSHYARGILPYGSDTTPRITVREVPRFRVLARRYIGDPWDVRIFWRDFATCLTGRPEQWRNRIFLGLMHDDPGTTPPGETRYDCCVVLANSSDFDAAMATRMDCEIIETRPGLYGCLQFSGPRDGVAPAYRQLCNHWLQNSRSFAITEDPAIEVHAVPRHRMDPQRLELTLLLALE